MPAVDHRGSLSLTFTTEGVKGPYSPRRRSAPSGPSFEAFCVPQKASKDEEFAK